MGIGDWAQSPIPNPHKEPILIFLSKISKKNNLKNKNKK